MTVDIVYATFPNLEVAESISRQVVDAQLAACANIVAGVRSIYRWQGVREEAGEVVAYFKTSPACTRLLIDAIAQAHPYDVPAIVAWPAAASHAPYAAWVESEVRSETKTDASPGERG